MIINFEISVIKHPVCILKGQGVSNILNIQTKANQGISRLILDSMQP